jgi:hypothetical protein
VYQTFIKSLEVENKLRFYEISVYVLQDTHCLSISSYTPSLLFTLVAGLLARSQYPEGPATGYLGTGFFLGFPVSKSDC